MNKLLCFLSVFFAFSTNAENELNWYAYDQPPAYIFSGKYQNQGYINKAQEVLFQQLPQYTHLQHQVTLGRSMHDLKSLKNVCVFGLFETPERRNFIYFSENALMHRGLQVFMRSERADSLALSGKVKLADLFERYDLKLVVIEGRSYSEEVDAILARYPNHVSRRSSITNQALFKMLDVNRFDFMLTFPSSAVFAQKEYGLNSQFVLFELEDMPKFATSPIGCSKSPWGKSVIADINKALIKVKKEQTYLDALSYWTRDFADHSEFEAYFNTQF